MNTTRRSRKKTGCLTCRYRRKKCDETAPKCVACDRNHLICRWPPQSSHYKDDAIGTADNRTIIDAKNRPTRNPNLIPLFLLQGRNTRLFEHFTANTSKRLVGRSSQRNPFLVYNVQMGHESEMMQHMILALSSCHLVYSDPSQAAICMEHYGAAMRLTKHSLTRWEMADAKERMIVLATVLNLCWFEVLNVNMSGAIFHHQRASEHMLLDGEKAWGLQDPELFGFFKEQYSYLVLVANICLGRDELNDTLDHLFQDSALEDLNKGTSIYGCLFGNSHQLYKLIHRISCLARICREEKYELSLSTQNTFNELLATVNAWTPDSTLTDDSLTAAGRIFQDACLVFLYASFHGPQLASSGFNPSMYSLLNLFLEHFSQLPHDSAPWTTISWPALVCGSCMKERGQRQHLSDILSRSTLGMRAIENIVHVLSLLWSAMDEDERYFGPYGLEQVLKIHGLNVCIG